jgi:hypothetical protein
MEIRYLVIFDNGESLPETISEEQFFDIINPNDPQMFFLFENVVYNKTKIYKMTKIEIQK